MDSIAALTALEKSRLALRDLVTAYDGVNLGAFTHPHPVLGVIDGYQWIAFLGWHEARHTLQIREAGEQLSAS